MGRTGSTIVFQKQMQIANLIYDNGIVYYAWSINLVQLLNSVLSFKVKAKDCIWFFAHSLETTEKENLCITDFECCKPSYWVW